MKNKSWIIFLILIFDALFLLTAYSVRNNFGILNPAGPIALAEKNLILLALGLMLIAVIPALVLIFSFAWKYRAGRSDGDYSPEKEHKSSVQILVWVLPAIIVLILSFITWKSAHEIDPKPFGPYVRSLEIQVVALDWKWLFIYPDQNIATVNFIQVPVNMPVHFRLTADAPMNSFWIPQLGGQIYAMSGMVTQLNLMASEPGDYYGRAAEINGQGFAGMVFRVRATSQADFDNWVASVKKSPLALFPDGYAKLSKPSENNLPVFYSSAYEALFEDVVAKYMGPPSIRQH